MNSNKYCLNMTSQNYGMLYRDFSSDDGACK